MEENRLDRIEKDLAEFIRGVMELRESQKETGEQLDRTIKNWMMSEENWANRGWSRKHEGTGRPFGDDPLIDPP